MRKRLIELIAESAIKGDYTYIPDVADYLIANGVTIKGEWISVDERLPNRDGTYLVYTRHGGIGFGEYRSHLLNKEGAMCEPQFDYYVTHWI